MDSRKLVIKESMIVLLGVTLCSAAMVGIFALLGSLVTFLGTYLSKLNTKKEEKNRKRIKNYLEEIKGFYNLEKLYMKAVSELREKIPNNQESTAPLGIQKEFRRINEDECGIILSMTDHQADKMLSNME